MGEDYERWQLDELRRHVRPLSDGGRFDAVLDLVGDAELVLLGEATHGTHDFYEARAEITRRLIEEKGFHSVAVEGDWPDCYRVNRYVRGLGDERSAEAALSDFRRFPLWMWRNTVIEELVGWMRARNDGKPYAEQAGFYGLDMYSLHGSMAAVLDYLERADPEAAQEARARYACFDQAGADAQNYGYGVRFGIRDDCRDEAIAQLLDLRERREELLQGDGLVRQEEQFAAEQNARVVQSAEAYYRNMFSYNVNTWNLRDQHMIDTLEALRAHLARQVGRPRIVVWEHNSHIGDARATEMSRRGEHNVGQLARERYGECARLIGFTTHHGTVSAASRWDGPVEHKQVRPGLPGSVEDLFHEIDCGDFVLPLREEAPQAMREAMLERAIGVIYLPQTERQSHYFFSRLPLQFDAVIHIDETRALQPLDPTSEWQRGEAETYPSGL